MNNGTICRTNGSPKKYFLHERTKRFSPIPRDILGPMRFLVLVLTWFCMTLTAWSAEPLIELARAKSASTELRDAIVSRMDATALEGGTAYVAEGGNFLFAVRSRTEPVLYVNGLRRNPMRKLPGVDLWASLESLPTGTSHKFEYEIDGKWTGGRSDIPAYLPECYEQAGVPQGKLSEKLIHTSQIYNGTVSEYWIYVPAQYQADKPAALMVWHDGHNHIRRDGSARTLNVIDNLIHQGKMPVSIHVFISPGMQGERRMRSIQYDTVDDTYARFLRDEILREVEAKYNIRKDAYSRAISGASSGAICAFNVAWQQPDQFSRVHSLIGSYTSIQWRPGQLEGGNVYPFKVRKEAKRNIRVWLQDGSDDLENAHGSWPLQNIQMANSLKMMGYDYFLSWGNGTHNQAHGNAELPRALTWLWRDYNPNRTEQTYVQDEAEKAKPYWRVTGLNRD